MASNPFATGNFQDLLNSFNAQSQNQIGNFNANVGNILGNINIPQVTYNPNVAPDVNYSQLGQQLAQQYPAGQGSSSSSGSGGGGMFGALGNAAKDVWNGFLRTVGTVPAVLKGGFAGDSPIPNFDQSPSHWFDNTIYKDAWDELTGANNTPIASGSDVLKQFAKDSLANGGTPLNPVLNGISDFTADLATPVGPQMKALGLVAKGVGKGLGMVGNGASELAGRALGYTPQVVADTAKATESTAPDIEKIFGPNPSPYDTVPPSASPEDINKWAFGEQTPPMDDQAIHDMLSHGAPATFKVQTPEGTLNSLFNKISPDVLQKATPPLEDPKLLANYLYENLPKVGMPVSKADVAALSYKDMADLANEIKPNVLANAAHEVSAQRGFNLDNLFNGQQTKLGDMIPRQNMAKVAGVPFPQLNFARNFDELLNGKPPMPETPPVTEPNFTMKDGPIQANAGALTPASDAITGETPAVENGMQRILSPGQQFQQNIKDGLKAITNNRVGNAIQSLFGSGLNRLPDAVRNAFLNGKGAETANQQKIMQTMDKITKAYLANGGNLDDLENARNVFEKTGQYTNDVHGKFIKNLVDASTKGLKDVNTTGLNALQKAGIAPTDLVKNYLHLSIDPKSIPKGDPLGIIDRMKGISRGYAKSRVFNTAEEARAAGYGVRDAASSTADLLMEHNKDLSNLNTWRNVRDAALKEGIATKDATEAATKGFQKFQSIDKNHALNGYYVDPALKQLATTMERTPLKNANVPLVSPALKAYDGLTNLFRTINLYNPLVHNHNTFSNALVSFGLHPENFLQARRFLTGKEVTPEMQDIFEKAMNTGALNPHDRMSIQDIENLMAGKGPNPFKSAYQAFQNKGLWEPEQQLRLGVFKQAYDTAKTMGLEDDAAANVARDAVNKHMIDYSNNNLSTFEREFMKRVDPFYNWHKGNYPLQFQNFVGGNGVAPIARAIRVQNALNGVQDGMTGHGMDGNMGGNAEQEYKLQIPLGNGNYASFDPYLPFHEPFKVTNDSLGSFLYGRLNPFMKEALDQATNQKYYPLQSVTPDGKDYMTGTKYEIRNAAHSGATNMWDSIAHMLNNMQPLPVPDSSSSAPKNPNYVDVPLALKAILGAAGGFTGSTPISESKLQAQQALEKEWMAQQQANAQRASNGGSLNSKQRQAIAREYGILSKSAIQ